MDAKEWQNLIDRIKRLWRSLETVESFEIVVDRPDLPESMDRTKVVRVGNDVIINSEQNLNNTWVARVREIRVRPGDPDLSEPCIRLTWYKSAQDLTDNGILQYYDVKPEHFAPRERIYSEEPEYETGGVVIDVVHVYHYNEKVLDPLPFSSLDFFIRHKIGLDCVISPPLDYASCTLCKVRYVPFRSSSQDSNLHQQAQIDRMRFCPGSKCHTWFHESCLLKGGLLRDPDSETLFRGTYKVRILSVNPDSDIPHPSFELAGYPYDPKNPTIEEIKARKTLDNIMDKLREVFPKSLISAAQSPFVKQENMGVFSIAGNLKDVAAARRLIYRYLEDPKGFKNQEFEMLEWETKGVMQDDFNVFICPRCSTTI